MKTFLYIVAGLALILIIGYKIASYKLISLQESTYAGMQNMDINESPRVFPDSLRMEDSVFWTLMNRSKSKYPKDFDMQIKFLTDTLSIMPEQSIVGFDCTLTENVVKLWNYNVKSLYQIVNGKYVSTDDFIYFRLYLISLGRDEFDRALNNPELLKTTIDPNLWRGELLMSAADDAYQKKSAKVDDDGCPRCICTDVSYDFGGYKMTGEYVSPNDFENKYPQLTEKY